MAKKKVLVLVGGISKDSLNRRLFAFFRDQAKDRFDFDFVEIGALPFFSQDNENTPPESVRDFQARAKACDAVLIVTPEYNRSYPGVLKNAIDWCTRPYGQNLWAGKPTGLIGTSPGAIGTFGAQNHLRQVLGFLDMRVMQQPEFYFTFPQLEDGKLPKRSADFLNMYIEKFDAWIAQHA